MKNSFSHVAVLSEEVIKALNIKRDGTYIDCTFGQGRHSNLILSQLQEAGKLIAIDRDPQSVSIAKKINDKRFTIKHGLFSNIYKFSKEENIVRKVNGILLDLGISTVQINDAKRGFSFKKDGNLDMRMNPMTGISAKEWLEKAKREEIESVLKKYGEEKKAYKISKLIFRYNHSRNFKKITCTKELVNIISKVNSYHKKHPATRTFQAIRIYINNELEELKKILEEALRVLAPFGRIVAISFHSLESRLIKNFIKKYSSYVIIDQKIFKRNQENDLSQKIKLKLINKVKPKRKEILENPRSRSSLLRTIEFHVK
ncbi:16S rRNA (cytosine(1402)-N(4))-methyltransferase RsmH [Candidatus Riesia pediculischaeffi]|uniref:Ribosomal RNA small subunit methyltransferase H n=2 Tax=Candidatus Riesia pediculischaeffi TaxID=428411 RepID=A0A1V0HKD0_9ENTR|nr:16S rRNA (cytosine(1402)-N(4))-methyltransferase RsmH [Candidatus Riesia pediculischaeffi]ARC53181.1 ribosomal RNA small subunit methyltransferase H [Candidatus Riesia pediculischaeffi]KIE64185.1 rRNA small subunit methyltransferase H [Candidatus Riesia pediculischaeffi PTSU]